MIIVALIILTALVPFVLNNYYLSIATTAFMYATLATSWNLIAGYCGYPAFGNVVFFGLGSYTVAVLINHGVALVPSLAAAVGINAVFAVLVGPPLLRLKGHYFAVASLALNVLVQEAILNGGGLTGGGNGLLLPLPSYSVRALDRIVYGGMAVLFAVCIGSIWLILQRRPGKAIRSIRGNEEAARALGVPVVRYKVYAWTVSAVFPAVAGGLYGWWQGYVDANSNFSLDIATQFVVMVLVGGLAVWWGPAVGAVILVLLTQFVLSSFLSVHDAVLGAIIIGAVMFIPRGLGNTNWRGAARYIAVRVGSGQAGRFGP